VIQSATSAGLLSPSISTVQVTKTYTVEIEGESKPALVADWITRLVYG